MSDIIKYISSFSQDAVHNAIEQAVGEEKEKFIETLESIKLVLLKPPIRMGKQKTIFHQSDKNLFEQKVLPQIAEKLADYDRQEHVEWTFRLDFLGEYKLLNLVELKKRHAMIIEDELSLACIDLVVKFHKGLVYYRARELHQELRESSNVKTMFRFEFGVSHYTAMRYISFAALVKRYPRIMVCGLSYAQITKHQGRLLSHLKVNIELHDKLSQPLSVSAQNKVVEIRPSDIGVQEKIYNIDPDYVFEDHLDNDNTPEDQEDAEWLNECRDILNDTSLDENVELTQELEGMCCNLH